MDQLPRLGKRELICLLLFTCNYVVSVWRGFLFLWVLGMGYVILLWHSLSLPYNYFTFFQNILRDVLLAWNSLTNKTVIYKYEILLNNSNIRVEDKTIIFKNWQQSGITYDKDLFHNG